ncbi:MAG: ribonuclease Y, partial [Planctomycetes bacterium]|nr:ribonuclease Y [Planctomycetota bacterium]
MPDSLFDQLKTEIASGDVAKTFDCLAGRLIEEKRFHELFDVRLMQARHRLGLPVILNAALEELPEEQQRQVEEASLEACREVGRMLLDEGQIGPAWMYLRAAGENEVKEQRQELNRMERRYMQREEQLERKTEALERQQGELAEKEGQVQQAQSEADALKSQQLQALEEIASLSVADARQLVVKRGEEEAQHELARRYYELEKESKEKADENARSIITLAINRLATDVVSETTTSVVSLPNDEMKGRLIGREGRNIRTLESLTGVDVIIDDTPEVVTISCFDPVRREVARLALEKLIADGRIQPARIEDMVHKAQTEVEQTIWKAGEEATFEVGVSGLDTALIRLLGQLKFRYSYGENVLKHSVEVALLSGMLAAEAGANVEVAKLGGLLHDIGKALTHEISGPHAEIGAEIAQKYGINYSSYRGILEHHSDDHETIESFLVASADAISAARPGARKESLELYVERLR